MASRLFHRRIVFVWPVLLALTACRDDEIVAYRVPKPKDPAPAAPAAAASPHAAPIAAATPAAPGAGMAGTTVATATGAALTWSAPAHWEAKAGSAMRKGTYLITGDAGATAELAITAFPGDVGGEAANVNRWRGQVGLPPLADAATAASLIRLEANGLKLAVVDAAGPSSHLLGAMVPFDGGIWFFKLVGPDALIAREKAAFLQFLQTVRPAEAKP